MIYSLFHWLTKNNKTKVLINFEMNPIKFAKCVFKNFYSKTCNCLLDKRMRVEKLASSKAQYTV